MKIHVDPMGIKINDLGTEETPAKVITIQDASGMVVSIGPFIGEDWENIVRIFNGEEATKPSDLVVARGMPAGLSPTLKTRGRG